MTEVEMTPGALMRHARDHCRPGRESECLLIVDEAHRLLNVREGWGSRDVLQRRKGLLQFFSEHRHFGFDVILIAQADMMVDKQARFLIEHEVKHFKFNQRYWWLPFPLFARVTYWYGMPKMHGNLDLAVWPLARGRYDHLAMRRRAEESGVFAEHTPHMSVLPTVPSTSSLANVRQDGA
jgi:hypothetical protein